MKTVNLDAFDLMEAVLIAERIHAIRSVSPSSKERILTASPFEGDYIGAVGEVAVCRYLNIQHPRQIRLGGDGGSDLSFNGWALQVKCTPTQVQVPSLIFKEHDLFSAEVAILTRMKSPTLVELWGCCSKAWYTKHATRKNFTGREDLHVLGSTLSDIDVIKQPKKAVA
jgi:hypothetical protein